MAKTIKVSFKKTTRVQKLKQIAIVLVFLVAHILSLGVPSAYAEQSTESSPVSIPVSSPLVTVEYPPFKSGYIQIKLEREFDVEFPTDWGDRRNLVTDYLRSLGYDEAGIDKWNIILTKETNGTLNPDLEPATWVKSCLGSNGWYAVELENYGTYWDQAYCNAGDQEGRNEKSTGIFQILWSNWDNYKCDGNMYNWKAQVNCAVKMQKQDGWAHWYYLI